jgi:hypothetical protein
VCVCACVCACVCVSVFGLRLEVLGVAALAAALCLESVVYRNILLYSCIYASAAGCRCYRRCLLQRVDSNLVWVDLCGVV